MKLFLTVTFVSLVSSVIGVSERIVIGAAFSEIVKNHFVNVSTNLRVVKYARNSTEIDGIANEILKRSENLLVTFDVINLKESQLEGFDLNQSAIVLFNDLASLRAFYLEVNFFDKSVEDVNIFAYYETPSQKVGREVTRSLRKEFVGHQRKILFLLNEGDRLKLETFSFFKPGNCGRADFFEINEFPKAEMKWKSDEFVGPESKNLNGCEIKARINPPDIVFNILEMFAKKLNFSMVRNHDENEYVDIIISLVSTNHPVFQSNRRIFHSHVFYTTNMKILVPPGELYSPLEKLFLPFDLETWICFVAVFVVSLLVTLILLKTRDSPKEIIFGSNVQTPTLNLFQHFFGLGQAVLPHRNFARFILMVFILFSLVMRTAYQGKLFEFITADMRKQEVKTIEEMNEKNLEIYLEDKMDGVFAKIEVFGR